MTTLAEIEKSFDDAMRRVEGKPEALQELRVQRAEAVTEFRLRDVQERERALWKREALTEFPLAREFADQVTGDTEEAIKDSARAMHDRLHKLFEAHQAELTRARIIEEHMNNHKDGGTEDAAAAATV